jgi:hypothetical protein
LLARVCERQTIGLRKLGDDRAETVKFRRFLMNERVTVEKMVARVRARVTEAAAGRHVLAIQDTSEINYEAKRARKHGLGTVGNGSDVGLFVHPVLTVDAESGQCLGLTDVQVWRRFKKKAADYRKQPIEEKESYRWLKGPRRAKWALAKAAMVTIIDDREGDIYEKWARLPDRRTHLLTRACRDRAIAGGGSLFATMAAFPEQHRFTLDLPARPGKRQARQARLSMRFGRVRICRPKSCSDRNAPPEIELFAIEVRELNPPAGEEPIHWRLLTTHDVQTVAQAVTVIGWYRQRWHVEQLFRTVKRQGLGIEQSVVEHGDALEKLAVIALIAACQTMQLVLARASTITISRQSTFLTTDRSRSWTPCRRDCKAAPPSSKIPIHPEPSLGPPGPSLASAAGPATKVNDPPDQSQCETGSNASMPSSKDTSSMKMCAHASPCGLV